MRDWKDLALIVVAVPIIAGAVLVVGVWLGFAIVHVPYLLPPWN